ncbi:MAG: alpha/beta hydrolase fold domain-containing protein [Pseudomonadota bacterium]
MSTRLAALNLGLRLFEKPRLARAQNLFDAAEHFERLAARAFVMPETARAQPGRLDGLDVLWVSCGRPDRRRVLLYFHGGAYMLGSPNTHQHLAAALACRVAARAAVVRYRLTPTAPFPAASDDALAAYRGLLDAGYEAADIALAGDSAGGGLALGLLHRIVAEDLPRPAAVVAFSPWTDLALTSDSLRTNARRDVLLPAQRLPEMRDAYLDGHDQKDPRASPVYGTFDAHTPVLIQASQSEILADDSRRMAARLTACGADVELTFWPRTPHVWQIFQQNLAEADEALDLAGAFLQRTLCAAPPDGPLVKGNEAM